MARRTTRQLGLSGQGGTPPRRRPSRPSMTYFPRNLCRSRKVSSCRRTPLIFSSTSIASVVDRPRLLLSAWDDRVRVPVNCELPAVDRRAAARRALAAATGAACTTSSVATS